jgi:hypothetical protein
VPTPCPQSAHNPVIACHLRDAVFAAQRGSRPLTSVAEITCRVIVSAYNRLLQNAKARHTQVDPRAIIGQDLTDAQLRRLQAERLDAPPTGRYALLVAGEDVTVKTSA